MESIKFCKASKCNKASCLILDPYNTEVKNIAYGTCKSVLTHFLSCFTSVFNMASLER